MEVLIVYLLSKDPELRGFTHDMTKPELILSSA